MSFNFGKNIKQSLESPIIFKEAQVQIQGYSLRQQAVKINKTKIA